jgi:hypothetical protein
VHGVQCLDAGRVAFSIDAASILPYPSPVTGRVRHEVPGVGRCPT